MSTSSSSISLLRPNRAGRHWNPLTGTKSRRAPTWHRWPTAPTMAGRPGVGRALRAICSRCARRARGTTSSTSRPAPEPGSRCATTPGPVRRRSPSMRSASCSTWPRRSPSPTACCGAGPLGDRLALRGSQLLGKTLGVVGLGAIGGRLVELCAPFGMEVRGLRSVRGRATAQDRGVQLVDPRRAGRAVGLRSGDLPADRRDAGSHRQGSVRRDEADRVLHHDRPRPGARRSRAVRRARGRWHRGCGP